MIWAFLVVWLFGGGHSQKPFSLPLQQAEALVRQHVADPARRSEATAILKQMAAIEDQHGKASAAIAPALKQIADDRNAKPGQFSQLVETEHAKAVVVQKQMLELRFKLKAQLTAEEWSQVFPAPQAAK